MEGMHVPTAARHKNSCWINNNPGNIMDPQTHKEVHYSSMITGWQNLCDLLVKYRDVHHYDLQQAIYHWAPPNENNTELYTQFVEDYTGINRKELL